MNKSEVVNQLKKDYPNPRCELSFASDYQLVVAVILSAQCTDKRVNQTTPALFKKYPTVFDLAKADLSDVEAIIKPCGFFKNKAKNIVNMAKSVVSNFDGKIPSDKNALKSLAGVGEKTANVVLANAFNITAIAVDTHVFRVSNRIGLANANKVAKTQAQLEKTIDKNDWIDMHHSLVLHGRNVCKAIKPKCEICNLSKNCKFYQNTVKNGAQNAQK